MHFRRSVLRSWFFVDAIFHPWTRRECLFYVLSVSSFFESLKNNMQRKPSARRNPWWNGSLRRTSSFATGLHLWWSGSRIQILLSPRQPWRQWGILVLLYAFLKEIVSCFVSNTHSCDCALGELFVKTDLMLFFPGRRVALPQLQWAPCQSPWSSSGHTYVA